MRRKTDMFRDFNNGDGASFLPGEGEQQATTAAAQMRERLAMVEEQLKSQFTAIAAYAQISLHAVETARAESRADLDREKATIISLLERLRDEVLSGGPRQVSDHPTIDVAAVETLVAELGKGATLPAERAPDAAAPMAISSLARIALLEDQFERLNYQFSQVMKSQEELANSIAFMFEHQMRNAGWLANCAEAAG